MPTYQYLCTACGHEFEVVQSFSDDAISTCEKCPGAVRKVYNSVGIVFKGSGFYKTDSRSASTASTSSKRETKSESKSDGKSETKTESKSTPATTSSD
ncbi:MAG: FmdB family zinc ribbon protein [Candidatus Nanopelagicaceae bacterium]